MALETQYVWKSLHKELYFFILKRVKQEDSAQEILQNTFFKIHNRLAQLNQEDKLRAWSFQIARNEIINFYKESSKTHETSEFPVEPSELQKESDEYCCFDKFLQSLPEKYHLVVEQVFVEGKTQKEAAQDLGISLANAKARIRRAKDILKQNFQECCNYHLNAEGTLTGEPDCSSCQS